jgi:hypothetical protein
VATSQRNAARGAYAAANKALAKAQLDAQTQLHSSRQNYAAAKRFHEQQLAAKDELIARMDAELTELSGRLSDAEQRLGLIDREEDLRDEVRAKRSSDL